MAVLEGHNMKIENAIIFSSTLEKIGWNILDASLGFVVLQGDPNQNFRFQMAVALSVFISDPMLVKLKCV